jgi:hypothetical protein
VTVQPGCHTFSETLNINGQQVATGAEQPGQPAETLLINPTAPPAPTPTPTPTPTSVPTPTSTPTHHLPPASTPAAPHTPERPKAAGGGTRRLAYTGATLQAVLGVGLLTLLAGTALTILGRQRRST